MWTDSHAHLYDLSDEELKSTVDRARLQNVSTIINCGTDLQTSKKTILQSYIFSEIYSSVGISPFDVENLDNLWLHDLEQLLPNNKVIAIGEIGIDNTNTSYPDLKKQIPIFEEQLELAVLKNLPVIIHSRGIEKKTAEICKRKGIGKAVFHCFTGDSNALSYILDLGYFVSVSGIITFKNSNLSNIIKSIPDDKLLIETDSPYLSPVPYRGKKNEPAKVTITGTYIAGIKNMDINELAKTTTQNAHSLFKLDNMM